MNRFFIFILLFSVMFGCQNGNQKTGDLPVIDLSKNYSEKEVRLQDIADIEYIPLETTDSVLLGEYSLLSFVSDKYIIVSNDGDVFIFNRSGKIVSHFNRKGQGGEEYPRISGTGVIFDEKNEEIFIPSPWTYRTRVYSITGEYNRTLKYSSDSALYDKVYNFDNETLLVYNDRSYNYSNKNIIEKPYRFMSKKDGRIVSALDINMPVRYTNRTVKEVDMDGQKMRMPVSVAVLNNRFYGNDFMLADISSDTIYRLAKNKDLTPCLVHTPSVHAAEPRIVLTPLLTTDKFIILQKTVLDLLAAQKNSPIPPPQTLMYEFETGQTSEVSFVIDDFSAEQWHPESTVDVSTPPNAAARLIDVSTLKAMYDEKRLKGKVEKLTEALGEEDNPVLMLVKFKQ